MAAPKPTGRRRRADLDQGIVSNAADAARVTAASRVLAAVLLRLDPAVQAAFDSWWARMVHEEESSGLTHEAVDRALQEDAAQLFALIRTLGLSQYRWLPRALRFEFQRSIEENAGDGGFKLPAFPLDLPWPPGRGPKNGPTHREDLEQNAIWFYRRKVRRDKMKNLTRDYLDTRAAAGMSRSADAGSVIRDGIRRFETLLACINKPLPEDADVLDLVVIPEEF